MALNKVLITGGAGNLGKYVTEELENDYELILADIKPKPKSLKHNYAQIDITKFREVKGVCQGVDAVLHLAAIPIDTGEALKIWDINFTGTFNMFEAAAQNRVKKFVFSSSICSYGFEFWSKPFTPEYLPLDENHPLMADDSYGMSKITGEVLGYGYSRRYGCSVHCFRLATIIFPGSENCESWVNQIDNPEFDMLPGVVSIKDTIWAYVDARDVAKAYRLALENDAIQFDIYNIGAEDIFSKEESLVLAKRYYPKCENISNNYFNTKRSRALYDISKAKAVLNYKPQHTWKDYL